MTATFWPNLKKSLTASQKMWLNVKQHQNENNSLKSSANLKLLFFSVSLGLSIRVPYVSHSLKSKCYAISDMPNNSVAANPESNMEILQSPGTC